MINPSDCCQVFINTQPGGEGILLKWPRTEWWQFNLLFAMCWGDGEQTDHDSKCRLMAGGNKLANCHLLDVWTLWKQIVVCTLLIVIGILSGDWISALITLLVRVDDHDSSLWWCFFPPFFCPSTTWCYCGCWAGKMVIPGVEIKCF